MNKDIEAILRYGDEVTTSKEKAVLALQRVGIMDEDGEIIEMYKPVVGLILGDCEVNGKLMSRRKHIGKTNKSNCNR